MSSDVSVVVTTLDTLDVEGVQYMLSELYDAFEKRTVILMNKIFPEKSQWSEERRDRLLRHLEATFAHPIIGIIPCYCDILRASRTSLFALDEAEHPFTKELYKVAKKLERF